MAAALRVPFVCKVSLTPPRPLSDPLFPLQEEHVLSLNRNSEGGTKLPTTVESLAKEHNIHPNLVIRHLDQLEELAAVYSVSKTHSVAYKGGLNGLFVEFSDDIIKLSQHIQLLFPKLLNCVNYSDGGSAVSGIVESLTFALSKLIMKAGHIVDTVGECDKSISYGDAHVSRVHSQAGALLKTTAFQKDLKNLGGAVPATVTTVLALQGGLAHMLVDLAAVKNKVDSGVRDPKQIFVDHSSDEVVRAWEDLGRKGVVPFVLLGQDNPPLT